MPFPYPHMDPALMGWWSLGATIVWIALIGLGIILVAWSVRPRVDDAARPLLDERLAKGEVDAGDHRARRSAPSH